MAKKRLSVRLNEHNMAMLQAIADSFFYDVNRNEGNISKALDWILTKNRLNDPIISMIMHFNRVQRGSLEEKDLFMYKILIQFAALNSPELLES